MARRRNLVAVGGIVLGVAVAVTSVRSQPTATQEERIVQPQAQVGGTLMVVVSAGNDMVWGYSKQTGLWHPLELVRPVRETPKVTCGECVAIVQAGSYVYGFSAEEGTWEALQLSQPIVGAPTIMKDWATITTIGRVHAFSGQTGTWATLDVKAEVRPARGG